MNGRFSLDLVAVGLLLTLLFLILLGLIVRSRGLSSLPGSVYNQGPEGTAALASRLTDWGYQVAVWDEWQPAVTGGSQLLLILAPQAELTRQQLVQLDTWVRNGGTLLVAQSGDRPASLLHLYNLGIRSTWLRPAQTNLSLPTFNWPLVGTVDFQAGHRLRLHCGQAAIHVGSCEQAVLISFGQGRGQVIYAATLHPFTNAGLQHRGNAQLVQNLVQRSVPPGAQIILYEGERTPGFAWLLRRVELWTFLAGLLLLAGYGLWHSQPFGRPRPTPSHAPPEQRRTAEFITQLALAQKQLDPARQIRSHYWQRLKRQFGRRYVLDTRLPDDDFLAELKPFVDDETLSTLIFLKNSRAGQIPSDAALRHWIATAVETARFGPNQGETR
jgi:hypothetical protein